jgi:hypothetical protein
VSLKIKAILRIGPQQFGLCKRNLFFFNMLAEGSETVKNFDIFVKKCDVLLCELMDLVIFLDSVMAVVLRRAACRVSRSTSFQVSQQFPRSGNGHFTKMPLLETSAPCGFHAALNLQL